MKVSNLKVFSGRRQPPRNFPASAAQQENPFTKDSCWIYVQRKENLPNLAHRIRTVETTLTYYHLGSWTTITDGKGSIEREQSFDAWGKMRDPYTWREFPSGGTRPQGPMFDRGFTGHEHLFEFGLINMNGRMYDPVMSTFLSVDNYVQSPSNSQNFNRYAYCLNNPLKYTDPDGEWFLTFGATFDKEHLISGGSIGVNFGLFGFGVNVGWGSGFSLGLYGEVGPHIGCAGVTGTLGVDYNFGSNILTTSLSANCGISLDKNNTYNLGLGLSGFCSYNTISDNATFGWGCHAGLGLNGDVGGFGIGASYSRCNGQNSFGLGLSGYREMPNAVYDFGVKDNPQTQPSYCVPGTLGELCRSLGFTGTIGSAEWWAFISLLYQQHSLECVSVTRNENGYYQFVYPDSYNGTPQSLLIDMINSSNIVTSEPILNANINSLIDAYNKGQKVHVSATWQEGGVNHGHSVAVSKVKLYSEAYRVFLADPSPMRQVPTKISSMRYENGIRYKYYSFQLKP